MKRFLNIVLRIGITAFLLWLISREIDFQEIVYILGKANRGIFLTTFLWFGIMALLCAWRWHILLLDHNVKITYFRTLAYYFIGYFYNNFLPTVIGGGAIRAFYVGKVTGKNKEAFSSMLTEIIIGGWALTIYALVSYLLWFRIGAPKVIVGALLGAFVLVSIALYLFFERDFTRKFKGLVEKIQILNIGNRLKELYETMYFYKDKQFSLLKIALLSLILQFIIGLMNFSIGSSLGYKAPFMSYIVYPAIIGVITTVPITINGLGLREWGYRFFFARVGLSVEQAIILSLLFWFVGVIGSLIGGIIFPLMKTDSKTGSAEVYPRQ